MKKLNLSIVFFISLVFFSCTVTKRKYLPGNHVEWFVRSEQKNPAQHETETGHALLAENETKPSATQHDLNLTEDTLSHPGTSQDTIIPKRNKFNGMRPDTIFCQITKITPTTIVYTKDGTSASIYRKKVEHVNRPLYTPEEVQVMAKRSKIYGWTAFLCFFPGGALFLIPLIIGIPLSILASRDSKRALEEIKKNPGNYSEATKKQARSGRLATQILFKTLLFIWAALTAFVLVLFAIVLKNGS